MTSSGQKPRLWVLPTGPYPRRVLIYLAEKGIADKFDIIPVNVTTNGQEPAEGKPPGTLPILELNRPTDTKPGRYIFQSVAMLEYLEDKYGHEGRDMRGATPEARARGRECMDVVVELTTWFGLYTSNGSSLYATMREQRREAATEGLEKLHQSLDMLERLADGGGPFLVGAEPMVVDCALMALVQFADMFYRVDLAAQRPRIRSFYEAFEGRGTALYPELPEVIREMENKMFVV